MKNAPSGPKKTALPVSLSATQKDEDALIANGFARQRANLERYAKMIEAGELPQAVGERHFIALFLRRAAQAHRPAAKKRAGRPVVYNKNLLVAEVTALIRDGLSRSDALLRVSLREGIRQAGIEKAFDAATSDARMAAAEFWFPQKK